MERLITAIMYILWCMSLIGLLVITFTSFRYEDLNLIVVILVLFTILNTFLVLKKR